MKIKIVKQYNPQIGWNIYLKDVNKIEIGIIISLVKNLGLKRNLKLEKYSKDSGGNNFIKKDMLRRIYTKKDSYFSFDYYYPMKDVAIIWACETINGEEFLSLVLSNMMK